MKTVLILRHAKSSWADAGISDHDRPLNKRGQRDAPRMGQLIAYEDIIPDLIASSTARRAVETAETVAENCDYEDEILFEKSFYHAPPSAYIEFLSQLSDETEIAMVVGHNPGLEALVALLTEQHEVVPTAALAQVALEITSWSELTMATRGQLLNFWRPKELPE